MKISRGKKSAEINIGKNLGSIIIYFSNNDFGYPEKGGINWSACGTRSKTETNRFIEALKKAIKIYK